MRHQINKLIKSKSTKAERRFMERLKSAHVKFRAKIKIEGREVDFLIGNYAIDIDGHKQAKGKNEMFVKSGYTPLHIENNEVNKFNINFLKKQCH